MIAQATLLEQVQGALEAALTVPVLIDVPATVSPPYVALYLIPGGRTWGPGWIDPDADAEQVVQTSCVGTRADQTLQLADRVREVMVGRGPDGVHAVDLPGVHDRRMYGGVPGLQQDGPPGERFYTVPERFTLTVIGG